MAFSLKQAVVSGSFASSSSSLAVSLGAGTTAGSVLLVAGMFDATTATGVTLSDPSSDVVSDSGRGVVINTNIGINLGSFIKGFFNVTPGTTTITANYVGGSPTVGDMFLFEVAGGTSVVFDKTAQTFGASGTADSGSTGTLSSATEFGIGYAISDNTISSQGTGWTLGKIDATTGSGGEYQVISSTTQIHGTMVNGGNQWIAWAATIMSGGAGASLQWGFECTPPDLPSALRSFSGWRRAGALMLPEPGIVGPPTTAIRFKPSGWEIDRPFPNRRIPNSRENRAGALMRGDDGISGPSTTKIKFQKYGWEVQPVQPPLPPWLADNAMRAGAIMPSEPGIEGKLIRFFPSGWEIAPHQPQNPPIERWAAIAPFEPGIEAKFVPPQNNPWGWEIVPFQPPPSPDQASPNKGGALTGLEVNIAATLQRFFPSGWEIAPPQPPTQPTIAQRYNAARGRSQFAFYSLWINGGWEVAPFQPPHPRFEKAAAIMPSEPGIEGVFVFTPPQTPASWGWEIAPFLMSPRYSPAAKTIPESGDQGTQAKFVAWRNTGWEVAPHQPQHIRIERAGAIAGWNDGDQFPLRKFFPSGWEVQPVQPPHRFIERAGAIMPSEPGIEGVYVFVPPPTVIVNWGWEIAPPPVQVQTQPEQRYAAIKGRSQFAIFSPWVNGGWEIVPYQPQPPRLRREKAGGIMPSEPGIEGIFIFIPPVPVAEQWWGEQQFHLKQKNNRYPALEGNVQFAAFPPTPYYDGFIAPLQPPRPSQWRAGAISALGGVDSKFVFVPPPPLQAWGFDLPFQPPRRSWEKQSGAIMKGDDGIEGKFIRFFPYGWEIAPHQPQHLRIERSGAIMPSEPGNEGLYVFVARLATWGWEIAPPITYHVKFEKAGAIARWEEGTEFPFVNFLPYGWEVSPHQPQHPNREKAGAIAPFEPGIEGIYVFNAPPFFTDAWEIQPFQPPHRGQEWKAGAIMPFEPGIEGPFLRWFNMGWEIQPFQPPHRAPEFKAASWLRGDDGIEGILIRSYPHGWEIQPYQPQHPTPERSGSIMQGYWQPLDVYVFVPPPALLTTDPKYITYVQNRVAVTYPQARVTVTYPQ